MQQPISKAQAIWAETLVDALARSGITRVFLSPGSRSTPFVLAVHAHPSLDVVDVVDERSAGFMALGHARVTGRPALLLCTSGSAPAHYYPSVLEASAACLPLVILSADRPHRLHEAGAPQTVDQQHLFGRHVRFFLDLGSAQEDERSLASLRRAASRAIHSATGPQPGPVHLNVRAKKPFEPPIGITGAGFGGEAPTRLELPTRGDALLPAELCGMLQSAKRPLLIAGPAFVTLSMEEGASFLSSALAFSELHSVPLLPEPASGLRFGGAHHPMRFGAFDALLRSPFRRSLRPDLIVQLGHTPVSKGVELLMESVGPEVPRLLVSEHGWPDPYGTATTLLAMAPQEFFRAVPEERNAAVECARQDYAQLWQKLAGGVRQLDDELFASSEFNVAQVFRVIRQSLPQGAYWMLGNSLAIRHADSFSQSEGSFLRVLSQRGLNGIDGHIAGAVGAWLQAEEPVVVTIGDVSFLHDLGSLMSASRNRERARASLVICILNNDGGQIFRCLPLGARDDLRSATSHFVTSHGLDFRHAAAQYRLPYRIAHDSGELERLLKVAIEASEPSVLEIDLSKGDEVAYLKNYWARVDGLMFDSRGIARPTGQT
ncbi:MAG: 2-succinyl-5-enolpyruvyl-6-hydroxy-3-cyclohexene-1-carboxylic-acid synthase [Myxococcota bacterium]